MTTARRHPADSFAARYPATTCVLLTVGVFGSALLFFWLLAGRPGLADW